MSDHEHHEHHEHHESEQSTEPSPPTQAQLYDDLRRIGQLEDQKHQIQQEIDERTERLRNAIPALDKSSLLYQLLSKSMKAPTKRRAAKKSTKKKTAAKKASKKK